MSHHQMNSLQEKLARQDAKIRDLTDKLITYNADMAIKDELNKQFIELDGWVQEAANKLEKVDAEQSRVVNGLFEKLKKSELTENSLRVDNHRLTGDNCSLTERLKTLQCDEQRRRAEAETMEACKKKLENELREANDRSRELSERYRCQRDELLGVRDQLERCRVAVTLVKDCNDKLETELEEHRATERRLEEVRGGLAAEVEDAHVKLEDAHVKLEDAHVKLEDARVKLEDERAKLEDVRGKLEDARAKQEDAEARAAAARERQAEQEERCRELAARLEDAEARVEESEERRARELEAAGRDAAARLAEGLGAAREQLRLEWETRVRLAEELLEEAETACERLRRERDAARDEREALENELRSEVADLERRSLVLRGEMERAGDWLRCGGGGGFGPSVAGDDETSHATPPSPSNACAHDGDAVDMEKLMETLKPLYRGLDELVNANRTRRLGDNSARS